MVIVTATTSDLIVKTPQYVEEATEGTTPAASPVFISCGPVSMLSIKNDGKFIEVGQIGAEDLVGISQGNQSNEFQIKFTLLNSAFLKYCVNAANYPTPTGTISKSLSILFSFWLNGVTESFVIFKGTRCKDVTITCESGKAHEVTASFICTTMTTPGAHGLTTPSFAATPSGTPWNFTDGGSLPLTWNAVGLNAKKFSITINRNAQPEYILGQTDPVTVQPHGRKIGGDFSVLETVVTLETEFKAVPPLARTVAMVLKSATSTITGLTSYLVNYNRDVDDTASDSVVENINFKCLSVNVT